jgi:hypothetical protein
MADQKTMAEPVNITAQFVGSLEKERLAKFFGKSDAQVIEKHLDDLERYFGSAAVVIRMVMQGRNPEQEAD